MCFMAKLLEIEDNLSFIIVTACPSNLVIRVRDHYWDGDILLDEQ